MSLPEADFSPPKPQLNDLPVMAAGVLAFGLSIPWLASLYGPLRPGDALWWVGQTAFIALAAALWGGNRWLLFKQREHFNWFGNPWRKLLMLVTANVLFTAPLTAAVLWAWVVLTGLPLEPQRIQLVVLANVICVLFVTHAYETLFLIREREGDIAHLERLQRQRAQAELAALKAQVDPHFLFNSLNTLGHLIKHSPAQGREFCDTLAEVYRYVLAMRNHNLVSLAEELAFVQRYHRLLELRFGKAVQLQVHEGLDGAAWRLPPMALQTLLENAVKHNQATPESPLRITVWRDAASLCVHNPVHPRSSLRPGEGVGLANLGERCLLLTGQAMQVQQTDRSFELRIPLLQATP